MKEIRIKQSVGKQIKLLLLAIIMVALSIAAAIIIGSSSDYIKGNEARKILHTAVMIISALFFGVALIFLLFRIIRPKDVLIINENGFTDRSAISSVGFVPWASVEQIYISSVMNQSFISVEIHDADNFKSLSPRHKRIFRKANSSLGFPAINITLNSAKEGYEDVLSLLQKYLDAYRSK